jgi:type III secretion protein Q
MTLQTPLRFPFLKQPAEWVRWANVVVGRARAMPFVFKQHALEGAFLPTKPVGYEATLYFKLQVGSATCVLGFSKLPPLEWLHDSLKGLSWQQVPGDVLAVLVEGFASEVLDGLQKIFQAEVSLQDISAIAPREVYERALYFSFSPKGSLACAIGHVWLDKTLAAPLGHYASRQLPCVAHPAWSGVPLRGRIVLGGTRLSQKDFLALQPNDIVLLDNGSAVQQGHYVWAWGPSCFFVFHYQQPKATLIHMSDTPPYAPHEAPTTSSQPQASEGLEAAVSTTHAPLGLDAVPVDLIFELGTHTLALQDLKSIAPGYTFELDNPVQKPVQIRLRDGGPVGVGELLDIGGKVGVRLVEFTTAL